MTPLPAGFAARPFAHRGLHDRASGIVENSASAVRAAIEAGYGIEIDVQGSADGQAVVFHDDRLDRLTAQRGPVRARSAAELGRIGLTGSRDTIPALADILALVEGRVALLVEIKDQSGRFGPTDGTLERAVAEALRGYAGPVAVMSFNPESIRLLAGLAPSVPGGLTTCPFTADDWPRVPPDRRTRLAAIADYNAVGASFVSHWHGDLHGARVAELKRTGATVLCWTVRSPDEERRARRIADTVTFEHYLPDR